MSELLRNLSNGTPWFSKPELVEIVAGTVTLAPRDVKRVSNFTLRVQLNRASDVQKQTQPADGADAPAKK